MTGSAPPAAKGNRRQSRMIYSLAGALPISFGLVGIDLAHALEQFFRVWLINFGSAGAFTAATRAGATVIDPTPWLCSDRCPLVVGDLLVYRDTNHMTTAYAQSLAPLLKSLA